MSGLDANTESRIRNTFVPLDGIDRVVLYGSRAKGNYRNGSDIDLTLFGKDLTLQTVYHVQEALDELDLPYHFDISLWDKLENRDLKDHIQRVGVVFFQRNG